MWTFLNTAFLWAGLAAFIPLVLHLLQRRRTVRFPFSTLRFLKLAQKKSSSRIRLENFLLWLLRTLLLLFLALAFAGPVLRAAGLGRWAPASRRDIALILDASSSMRYESGFLRVWETTLQAAADLVQELKPGDRASLFLAREDPLPLVEQPTGNLELLLSLIRAQSPAPAVARLKPALRAAAESLQDSGAREKEIFILTDGQALAWTDFLHGEAEPAPDSPADDWKPDPHVALFALLAGPDHPENAFPYSLEAETSLIRAGQPAKLRAGIGFSGPARPTTAALFVNDREVARRMVDPGQGDRQDIAFTLPPLPAGRHAVRLELPPDALAIDDVFHAVVHARDQLPVLAVGRDADLFFLTRALNPPDAPSSLDVRVVNPAALADERLADFACVFLCNAVPLPGQSLVALEQYVRNGGAAVLFPGDRGAPADYEPWSALPARPVAVRTVPPRDAARTLRLLRPEDPLFAGLRLPPGATPAVAVRRRLEFGTVHPDAEVVIGMGGDQPFLLSRRVGRGRLLLCAVPADRSWSSLPLSPFFLPMLHRIALFSTGVAAGRLYVHPAPIQEVTDIFSAAPDAIDLVAPSGAMLPVRRLLEDNREARVLENLTETGVYRAAGGGEEPLLAVNLPRQESDLTPVDPAALVRRPPLDTLRLARTREDLLRQVREHRVGAPLAELFLWLALVTAILESLVAARAARRAAPLAHPLAVEPSGRVRPAETGGAPA